MASGKLAIRVCVAAVLLLLFACCAPDAGYSQFVKITEAERGVYPFEVSVEDTLSTYTYSFYTRIDARPSNNARNAMRLDVTWTSPSGRTAEETVYMDISKEAGVYRSGVRMREAGNWKFDVRVPDVPNGFCGLGIICKKDGTR